MSLITLFRKDKFLLFITMAVLFFRLAVLVYVCLSNPLGTAFFSFPDSAHYLVPAKSLLAQGALLEAYTQAPLTFRTPGYPVFLAGIFLVFGESAWAVGAMQILLSVLLIPLTYCSALQFLPRSGARAASFLCAISTGLFAYSFAYLSDVLFAFCMTVFLWAALAFLREKSSGKLLGASLALTFAIFVRPVAYNVLFIGMVLLTLWMRKEGLKKIIFSLILFSLPVLLFTGAWQLRNYKQTGYGKFHSSAAYNLYFWNLDAVALENHVPAEEGSRILVERRPADFDTWTLSRQDDWLASEGKKMIVTYLPHKLRRAPFWLAKTLLGGSYTQLSRIFFGRPPLDKEEFSYQLNKQSVLPKKHLNKPEEWCLFVLCLLQTICTALLAGVGVLLGIRKNRTQIVFLVIYVGYFWGISSAFFGAGGRYRLPFETALCVLGGIGWILLREKYLQKQVKEKESPSLNTKS